MKTENINRWTRDMAVGYLLALYKFRCDYCWRALDENTVTLDHIDPAIRGYDPYNLVFACRSCNSRKGSRTPQQWLDDEHEKALFDNALYDAVTPNHDIEALRAAVRVLVKYPSVYERLYKDRKWEAYA